MLMRRGPATTREAQREGGQPAGQVWLKRASCTVYRVDPGGRIDMVVSEGAGISASLFARLQRLTSNRQVTASTSAPDAGEQLAPFADFMVDGVRCGNDGIRTDVFGNLWPAATPD
jgi:gluconolactonase